MKLFPDDVYDQNLTGNNGAVFSTFRDYRYMLYRTWNSSLPSVAFIGLNPSTAGAFEDDATIRRCVTFATRWGFGRLFMVNLYGYIATQPKDMKKHADPIGDHNFEYIKKFTSAEHVGQAICCWGGNVDDMLKSVWHHSVVEAWRMIGAPKFCLGTTNSGQPKHPLRLSGATERKPYNVLPVDLEGRLKRD